ncbi:MAG: hypothetical protein ABEK12_03715, partial [Candidatus Nanohaloarchaea archaeon]
MTASYNGDTNMTPTVQTPVDSAVTPDGFDVVHHEPDSGVVLYERDGVVVEWNYDGDEAYEDAGCVPTGDDAPTGGTATVYTGPDPSGEALGQA